MKFILLSFLVLIGCAPQQVVIREEGLMPLRQYRNKEIKVRGNPQLSIVSFENLNQNQQMLGQGATGLLNSKANLVTEVPIADFVKSRFAKGLEFRGFDLNQNAKYGFVGRIRRVWVKEGADGAIAESTNCHFEMQFELINQQSRKTEVTGNLNSEVVGSNSPLDATASNGPVLETCITLAINKFLKEDHVITLLGLQLENPGNQTVIK